MKLLDSHCHLSLVKERGIDLNEIFQKNPFRFSYCLDVGIEGSDFQKRYDFASQWPFVYYSVGLHPQYNDKGQLKKDLAEIEKNITHSKVIALGEIGLDYFHNNYPADKQKDLFWAQCQIAQKYEKPILIHTREAIEDTYVLLKEANLKKAGIIHCFSANYEYAVKLLDLGYRISFAGNLTFKNAQNLRDVAEKLPSSSLLVETDAPFLAPVPFRGKINNSSYVINTLECLAQLQKKSPEKMAEIVEINFEKLFFS